MTAALARTAGAVALAFALAGCRRADPLPVLGEIPAFTLTSEAGDALTTDALRGHVWIADFVFTRCPDVCPVLTQRMRQVRQRLPSGPDGVRIVSFSVDPTHDTPEVLRTYAAHHQAGPNWTFVTGPRDAIATVLRDGFKVAFGDDGPADRPITHSDRFVLVDPSLRIRGYYRGTEPEALERLVGDASALLRDTERDAS